MSGKTLSHEEIWDDSELVTSWNEAVAEYKKYHSLAAKGLTVEQALIESHHDQVLAGEEAPATTSKTSSKPQVNGETQNLVDASQATEVPFNHPSATVATKTSSAPALQQNQGIPQALLSTGISLPLPPRTVLHLTDGARAVQDEALKNIMMSWYYAGYYTGLYEGQQKAYAAMQQQGG